MAGAVEDFAKHVEALLGPKMVRRQVALGELTVVVAADTIVQTLTAVQYDEKDLARQLKAQIDDAIKGDRMKPSEGMRWLDDYERGLREYTYLTF